MGVHQVTITSIRQLLWHAHLVWHLPCPQPPHMLLYTTHTHIHSYTHTLSSSVYSGKVPSSLICQANQAKMPYQTKKRPPPVSHFYQDLLHSLSELPEVCYSKSEDIFLPSLLSGTVVSSQSKPATSLNYHVFHSDSTPNLTVGNVGPKVYCTRALPQ